MVTLQKIIDPFLPPIIPSLDELHVQSALATLNSSFYSQNHGHVMGNQQWQMKRKHLSVGPLAKICNVGLDTIKIFAHLRLCHLDSGRCKLLCKPGHNASLASKACSLTE